MNEEIEGLDRHMYILILYRLYVKVFSWLGGTKSIVCRRHL